MKYCKNCGKELEDDIAYCPKCGCETNNTPQDYTHVYQHESDGLAKAALILAFLLPVIGFVLGIIGAVTYKTKQYKNESACAAILSIVVPGFIVAVYFLIIALMLV